ncbi:946_t:CDS:2 [Cetraspora pellucida]|uniref:946_t:CDS:1 n=1 Tax=Cetraspora pellucida TaxID=1433469 RepID=A0ACA9LAX8_9GLOM|nr:946_t:CDS:2 [Cetraspora pellucida]
MIQQYPDSASYLVNQLYSCRGVLPDIHNEDYYSRYFKLVNESCQRFLTAAILKIQCCEMNYSIHYRVQLADSGELENQYLDKLICEADINITSESAILAISSDQFGLFEHNLQVNFTQLNSIRSCHVFTNKVRKEMLHKQQWGEGFGILKKTLELVIATGKYKKLYELHLKLSKEMKMKLTKTNDHNVLNDNSVEFATTISNPVGIYSKGQKPKNASAKAFNDDNQRVELQDISNLGTSRSFTNPQENYNNHENIGESSLSEDYDNYEGEFSVTSQNAENTESLIRMNQEDYDNHGEFSLSVTRHSSESLTRTVDKNITNQGNKSRQCGICGQASHNSRTCNSDGLNNCENIDVKSSTRTVDKNLTNYGSKSCHCGSCGQTGHNTRTCSTKK